jgi:hypothetical protein
MLDCKLSHRVVRYRHLDFTARVIGERPFSGAELRVKPWTKTAISRGSTACSSEVNGESVGE